MDLKDKADKKEGRADDFSFDVETLRGIGVSVLEGSSPENWYPFSTGVCTWTCDTSDYLDTCCEA